MTEHDLLVGSALPVAGTLHLPDADGSVAAVVLLGGSGPTDMDATCGPNKPMRDVARGLAAHGVASLRFDKVTRAYRDAEIHTIADEYVTHALSAIDLARDHPKIDPGRLYLLGHSQGGSVAPRVAEQAGRLAGVVLLAAAAASLQSTLVRQSRYLAGLAVDREPYARAVADLERAAALVDGEQLTERTPTADLPLGIPASYWLDLRHNDPVATAGRLAVPMLILQGGRDYQVTVEDDFRLWVDALHGRSTVTTRVYPNADHYFFDGCGPSTPASYRVPQHVDPVVVADIARWITDLT